MKSAISWGRGQRAAAVEGDREKWHNRPPAKRTRQGHEQPTGPTSNTELANNGTPLEMFAEWGRLKIIIKKRRWTVMETLISVFFAIPSQTSESLSSMKKNPQPSPYWSRSPIFNRKEAKKKTRYNSVKKRTVGKSLPTARGQKKKNKSVNVEKSNGWWLG